VVAGALEELVSRRDLEQDAHVASRADGDRHPRDTPAEDHGRYVVHAEAGGLLASLEGPALAGQGELDRVFPGLTGRVQGLAERYAEPLPQLTEEVATLTARVKGHLTKMGATWR